MAYLGQSYSFRIINKNSSGALANGTVTAALLRNGVDSGETVPVSNQSTGRYLISATIPAGWTLEDIAQLEVTVDGVPSLIWGEKVVTRPATTDQASNIYSVVQLTDADVASIKTTVEGLVAAIWSAGARTLTEISDSSGVTTLLSRIASALNISGGKVEANVKQIADSTVAVDTNTAGQISFISGAYVATSGGTVNANIVQVGGENIHDDGDGRMEVVGGGGESLSGPFTRTITVLDDATSQPIESAKVRLFRTGESESKPTNSSGVASFTVEAATWSYAVTASGYAGASGTIAVSANGNTNVRLVASSPVNPDPADLCDLSFKVASQSDSVIASIIVTAKFVSNYRVGSGRFNINAIETNTPDNDGNVTLRLFARRDLHDHGTACWPCCYKRDDHCPRIVNGAARK